MPDQEKQSIMFDDFTAVYGHSSDFPDSARDMIPKELWHAVDDGNAVFLMSLHIFNHVHRSH